MRQLFTNLALANVRLVDGGEEVKLASGIVFALERVQTGLAPLFVAVQFLVRLIAVRIVDIGVQLGAARALVEDIAQLVAQVGGLLDELGVVGGLVVDKRGDEEVITTEGESRGVGIDSVDALAGVALEHEDGVAEVGVRTGARSIQFVGLLHGGGIVLLQVDGEARVGGAILGAGRRVEGDVGPGSEVLVGSGLRCGGERADIVEGLGVGRVDGLDTLLEDVHDDDGLIGLAETR